MTQPAKRVADERRGLVQVYTGDGKGKTTAAIGAAVRALGQGSRVTIIFFMKRPDCGEYELLSRLPGVSCACFGAPGFIINGKADAEDEQEAARAWAAACEAVANPENDLVILDEACLAVDFGLLDGAALAALVRDKPVRLNLILTGRRANAEIIKIADMVTECVKIKHHYDKGVPSRKGIEY